MTSVESLSLAVCTLAPFKMLLEMTHGQNLMSAQYVLWYTLSLEKSFGVVICIPQNLDENSPFSVM